MLYCVLAFIAGGTLAAWAPIGQFVGGLLATTITGITIALLRGLPVGSCLKWGLLLFSCTQVGYGIGLGVRVLRISRRETSARQPAERPVALSFPHKPFPK